jgi:hypothetical protein
MKGLELPINIIMIMAIAVVVLVAVAAYFVMSTGERMNTAEAKGYFAMKCQDYCTQDTAADRLLASDINQNPKSYDKFVAACSQSGIIIKEGETTLAKRCIEACPCNLGYTPQELFDRQTCDNCCYGKSIEGSAQCLADCGNGIQCNQ